MEQSTTERREYDSVTTPTGDLHVTETVTVENSADLPELAPVVVVADAPAESEETTVLQLLADQVARLEARMDDILASARSLAAPADAAASVAGEPAESETVVAVSEEVAPKPADATEGGESAPEGKSRKKAAGVFW